jgi:hypothetical protein
MLACFAQDLPRLGDHAGAPAQLWWEQCMESDLVSYDYVPRAQRRATVLAGLAAVLALPCGVAAQGPAVTPAPRSLELGIDAGAVVGLGDQSSISVNLPAARFRAGVPLRSNSRWTVEPALLLSYSAAEGSKGVLFYNLEAGALYHFRPPPDLERVGSGRGRSVAYARPFVNLTGVTDGDSELSVGGGLGIKVPWRPQLAWRLEGNVGYGFDNEAFRLGAFAGLSFFTRRGT